MKTAAEAGGDYWSKVSKKPKNETRPSWGHSPIILSHLCRRLGRPEAKSPLLCLIDLLRDRGFHTYDKAVSVGAGTGEKEISLVASGLVKHFTLYEVSSVRADAARDRAAKLGVADQIHVSQLEDAFTDFSVNDYDLVFWSHSLHHMPDSYIAVDWSRKVLKPGGVFLMNEFVGAPRFQWSDEALQYASSVRQSLPPKLLKDPIDDLKMLPRSVNRQPREKLIARDPTEAIDSDRIIPATLQYFPNAEIYPLGGIIYHLALNEIIGNFMSAENEPLLNSLLLYDELLSKNGMNNFAAAIATKD